ncbi:MAG: hypothetical protein Q8O95_00410 [bacterium]|nr:hypothetical protein [bacterium]
MKTLSRIAEEADHRANTFKQQVMNSLPEGMSIGDVKQLVKPERVVAEQVREAIRVTYQVTGIDTAQAKVDTLPGNTAGEYHMNDGHIEIDLDIARNEDVGHVALHEAWHKANKKMGDDEIIASTDFEEALTERATEETTGQRLAYHEEDQIIGMVVSRTRVTRKHLIGLFKKGENAKLNGYYEEAYEEPALN